MTIEYEVITTSGEFCASSTSLKEALHYALVYGQDEPVEVIEAHRLSKAHPGQRFEVMRRVGSYIDGKFEEEK